MKKIIVPALALTVVAVLGGCSYGGSKNTPSGSNNNPMPNQMPAPSADQGSQPGQQVASNAINIQNFSFTPQTLTVKTGTTVVWTNNDSTVHQIKSATFNSSQLSKGQTFSFTFNDKGTFDYICSIHPSMTGKIIVEQ